MMRLQRLTAARLPIFVWCLWLAVGSGCAAREAQTESQVPVVEVAAPATDVAVDPEVGSVIDPQVKETCTGAVDCTFFGLGAALAAPFWVLGALLGLVF